MKKQFFLVLFLVNIFYAMSVASELQLWNPLTLQQKQQKFDAMKTVIDNYGFQDKLKSACNAYKEFVEKQYEFIDQQNAFSDKTKKEQKAKLKVLVSSDVFSLKTHCNDLLDKINIKEVQAETQQKKYKSYFWSMLGLLEFIGGVGLNFLVWFPEEVDYGNLSLPEGKLTFYSLVGLGSLLGYCGIKTISEAHGVLQEAEEQRSHKQRGKDNLPSLKQTLGNFEFCEKFKSDQLQNSF